MFLGVFQYNLMKFYMWCVIVVVCYPYGGGSARLYFGEYEYVLPEKGGLLMDVGTLAGIIALCVSCFLAGVQYGKDHRNEK